MKIESLREVKNNFSEVIEALPKTGPVVVTKNGRSAALLLPIDEDTVQLQGNERRWRNCPTLTTTRRGSDWPVRNGSNERAMTRAETAAFLWAGFH
jgi:prevent-host-death family protein